MSFSENMNFSEDKREKRVILLGKALTLNRSHYHREHDKGSPLVSLGYFDSIDIRPLPLGEEGEGWLKALWECSVSISANRDSDTYYHPLYIIAPPNQDVPSDFWEEKSKFLFVTLVHFTFVHATDDSHTPDEDLFTTVSKEISEIVAKSNAKKENEAKQVRAFCYQSMDLSDMVVVWKANSLVSLLRCLSQLYLCKNIGDLHSICSFPCPTTPTDDSDESIPYVSFRFSTRDTSAASSFDKLLHEKWPKWPASGGYFTTGTEDIDITFNLLPVPDFLKLIYLWFEDKDINELFRKAFYKSSTHLGVLIEGVGAGNPESLSNALISRCEQLFKEFQDLRTPLDHETNQTEAKIDPSWCKSVSSQLSALVDMSRICVLDGFCYLILDGVATFCRMVRPYLSENRPMSPDLLERVQRFVRGWGILVDQAVRADGQFIQSPGFSPTLYDIPVSLLEFYLAFTTQFIDLMQSSEDQSKRHHYALFLLPKLCRRTKVRDIFQDPPPHDRLLYVDIPLDLLYDPQQILLQLCHEASHYCGEAVRCREVRTQHFVLSCAYLVAWNLGLLNVTAVKQIYQDLLDNIPYGDDRNYLKKLTPQVRGCICQIIQNENVFRKWQDSYLTSADLSPREEAGWMEDSLNLQRTIVYGRSLALVELSEDIGRISWLFEEGYADISMIFLLAPTGEEYLALYRQEIEWLSNSSELTEGHGSQYAELVQRAAIVLWAAQLRPKQCFFNVDDDLHYFSMDVSELYDILETAQRASAPSPDNLNEEFFPVDLLSTIADYLRKCCQAMARTLIDPGKHTFLKRTFDQVARKNSIGCEEFQRSLLNYEKKLLKNFD